MEKYNYSKIKTLSDIKRRKRVLKRKARIRERILLRKLNIAKDVATPAYFYDQFLKGVKMENSIFTILPYAAKLGEPLLNKLKQSGGFKKIFPIIGGVGVGVAGLFAFLKKFKKNSTISDNTDEELFV